MPAPLKISLTDEEDRTLRELSYADGVPREILESLLRRQKTPVGLAKRARAILLLAQGERFNQTAERVGLGERHLRKWARRFIEQGVEGL